MGEAPPPAGLSLCDSAPLLWRVQDVRAVRARGLVGVPLGSLARAPRQNGRMGRPVLLLPEEERLLAEQGGAGRLRDRDRDQDRDQNQEDRDRDRDRDRDQDRDRDKDRDQYQNQEDRDRDRDRDKDREDQEQVSLWEQQQSSSFEDQRVLALEDRKAALIRVMAAGPAGEASGPSDRTRARLDALDRGFSFPRAALAVQLSTARAGLGHRPEARGALRPDWPIRARDGHWDARYQVFRDLRGRGFYLTAAGKFGGDFLVYPGDPLRFHAHFVAVCLPMDASVPLLDVLAVARLGSNVKKTVLLCSAGPDGRVQYTSVQWSGLV